MISNIGNILSWTKLNKLSTTTPNGEQQRCFFCSASTLELIVLITCYVISIISTKGYQNIFWMGNGTWIFPFILCWLTSHVSTPLCFCKLELLLRTYWAILDWYMHAWLFCFALRLRLLKGAQFLCNYMYNVLSTQAVFLYRARFLLYVGSLTITCWEHLSFHVVNEKSDIQGHSENMYSNNTLPWLILSLWHFCVIKLA